MEHDWQPPRRSSVRPDNDNIFAAGTMMRLLGCASVWRDESGLLGNYTGKAYHEGNTVRLTSQISMNHAALQATADSASQPRSPLRIWATQLHAHLRSAIWGDIQIDLSQEVAPYQFAYIVQSSYTFRRLSYCTNMP